MFEQAYEKLLLDQRRSAKGGRLELLHKDLAGTKKLLMEIIWPVLKSFEGIILEYELMSTTGVRIYVDVFYEPLSIAFESEGYVVHAENITRDRFTFEKMRVRTMLLYGYKYVPFTWDELDKRSEACRRFMYELLGRFTSSSGSAIEELSISEREVLRYALRLNRHLQLKDACYCLQWGPDASRRVLRSLVNKKLIKPVDSNKQRWHKFTVDVNSNYYLI